MTPTHNSDSEILLAFFFKGQIETINQLSNHHDLEIYAYVKDLRSSPLRTSCWFNNIYEKTNTNHSLVYLFLDRICGCLSHYANWQDQPKRAQTKGMESS